MTTTELHKAYLSWINDYLTIATFAEHHNWSLAYAFKVIRMGSMIHEQGCK